LGTLPIIIDLALAFLSTAKTAKIKISELSGKSGKIHFPY